MNQQIIDLVNDQAEDEGIWFDAETATEAYLQVAIRKLHAEIENEINCDDCGLSI